jgi:hypothetical protein
MICGSLPLQSCEFLLHEVDAVRHVVFSVLRALVEMLPLLARPVIFFLLFLAVIFLAPIFLRNYFVTLALISLSNIQIMLAFAK